MSEIATSPKCPECGVSRGPDSSYCSACGLIFVGGAHPQRRQSDRRRASDMTKTTCHVCRGTIEQDAQRCVHCGEIIDPAYRAAKARLLRSQINYASWVAYILGFLMLFIFRPVGIIAIIAGLLLSIAYYAIRIPDSGGSDDHDDGEGPDASQDRHYGRKPPSRSRFSRFLSRQFGVETVRLGPADRKKIGLVVAGTPLLLVAIGWATNYSMLQIPIDRALASETDFPILEIAAHYEYFVLPGTVVLEIEKVGDTRNAEKALMKIASEFEGDEVEIRLGENALRLEGERFRTLSPAEIRDLVRTLTPQLYEAPAPEPTRQVRIPVDQP